jgi:hypothetical protein
MSYKDEVVPVARRFSELGFDLVATRHIDLSQDGRAHVQDGFQSE